MPKKAKKTFPKILLYLLVVIGGFLLFFLYLNSLDIRAVEVAQERGRKADIEYTSFLLLGIEDSLFHRTPRRNWLRYRLGQGYYQENYSYVKIIYPKFKEEKLNNLVVDILAEFAVDNTKPKSIADFVQNFYSYKRDNRHKVAMAYAWRQEIVIKLENYGDYLQFRINEKLFSGGAHSSYQKKFYHYSTKAEKLVGYNDIFSFARQKELKQVGEQVFLEKFSHRKNSIKFYEGFYLPEQFLLTSSGIRFVYPLYSVTSFAGGLIEFEIAWEKLSFKVL